MSDSSSYIKVLDYIFEKGGFKGVYFLILGLFFGTIVGAATGFSFAGYSTSNQIASKEQEVRTANQGVKTADLNSAYNKNQYDMCAKGLQNANETITNQFKILEESRAKIAQDKADFVTKIEDKNSSCEASIKSLGEKLAASLANEGAIRKKDRKASSIKADPLMEDFSSFQANGFSDNQAYSILNDDYSILSESDYSLHKCHISIRSASDDNIVPYDFTIGQTKAVKFGNKSVDFTLSRAIIQRAISHLGGNKSQPTPNFRSRFASVRNRSAFSLMNPAASRWS